MDRDSLTDETTEYDVFQQNSPSNLEVAEAKPLEGNIEDPLRNEKPKRHLKFKKRYLLVVLAFIILLGSLVAGVKFFSKKAEQPAPTTVVVNTQSLDNGTLNQVTPTTGGDIKQQLTISPNTIFKNDVAVQGSLDVAKNLSVNGSVNVQGAINTEDSLSVGRSLSVGNNLTVNGLITAASLSVGTITISSINVSSNLVFGGHIVPFGSEPNVKTSVAAAGGTVSISGNDTAGTITITTGNGNLAAGELAVITFRAAFSATPKVQLTPLSSGASELRYFATHTASFFTINTSSAPTAGKTYIFDYFVTQ